ncbi:FMN-binding protein [Anaerocolumna sp. MB42-C2]|uniref:FMN-binding protein n=1 Tax=Anaerocolumna sp. MB42-C2 TaxID=3070997 RepID=UPI0027E109B1|nr:FMN-binding protein [Anaerocolumna sp. MB42-C2]WMJ89331.1 FMN-binding protein [Anaerocolumna sp. MB42-C2]
MQFHFNSKLTLNIKVHKLMGLKLYILPFLITALLLTGCSYINTKDTKVKKYSAAAAGYGGDVTVEVTAASTGKIGTLRVDASQETPDIGGKAASRMAKTIVAKQSLSIDSISGATITCKAVLSAAETALKEAGIDTEALKGK